MSAMSIAAGWRPRPAAVSKVNGRTPKTVTDFRRILDDKKVDVLVVATCNHWHAPAAILACAAGKHVYVEKPCSHNPREGELLVAGRPQAQEAGADGQPAPQLAAASSRPSSEVRDGAIGRAYLAQSWYYNNRRGTIGKGKPTAPPKELDYDLWQGPAPRRPFHTNYLHYNWHWFWHWGNGELGNNGVHMHRPVPLGPRRRLPHPRHLLRRPLSLRGRSGNARTRTWSASTSRAARPITWEGLSCNRPAGRTGTPTSSSTARKAAWPSPATATRSTTSRARSVRKEDGAGRRRHALRQLPRRASATATPLNSEIEEGHKSTLLCHLGNIAQRARPDAALRSEERQDRDDKEAMALWTREYEKGWEPKV